MIKKHNVSQRGFSLVELVIAIAIIGTTLGLATVGFNHWQTKSRVETQVKQMVADINELRMRALTTKQRHSLTLNASSYIFKSYSSENQTLANGNIIPGGTRNVTFGLKKSSGTSYGGEIYQVNESGMFASVGGTIFLDYVGSTPALDCLVVSTARVNPGKMSGATCNDK
jgi:prepilin-type N-terminal cleavage/methylation domain-containing protein